MPLELDSLRNSIKTLTDLLAVSENDARMGTAERCRAERHPFRCHTELRGHLRALLEADGPLAKHLRHPWGCGMALPGVSCFALPPRTASSPMWTCGCSTMKPGTPPPTSITRRRPCRSTEQPGNSRTTREGCWKHWKRAMIDLRPDHLDTVQAHPRRARARVRSAGLRLPRRLDRQGLLRPRPRRRWRGAAGLADPRPV